MKELVFDRRKAVVTVPRVPNFIMLNGSYVPLSEFSPKELRAIGKAMTERLLNRAKEQEKAAQMEKAV